MFVICALAVFAVPVATFDAKSSISTRENRYLAALPSLVKDNHLNLDLFREFDAYFADRFGLRRYFIALNNRVDTKLHAFKGVRVLEGKDGWQFYIDKSDGDNYSDFMKQNLLLDATLAEWKDNVANTAAWCEAHGIKAIFLICPNKHSIYPEYYPFPRPEGITRSDQLVSAMTELGVDFVFPRDEILAAKSDFSYPLYYETDTHWNPQGAYIAFSLLKQYLQKDFPTAAFPEIDYDVTVDFSKAEGDLLPMLSVTLAKSTRPTLSPRNDEVFYEYIKNAARDGVITKGKNKDLPRALIFRDSFFTALEPFTSPMFSEAEYIWREFRDSEKEYVLQYKPDVIIFERVERASANNFVHCSK